MYYHNPKVISGLKGLSGDIYRYAVDTIYAHKSVLNQCEFFITTDDDRVSHHIRKLLFSSYGVTSSTAYVSKDINPVSKEFNLAPIESVKSKIYVSENTILGLVLDYELDFDRVKKLMHFIIKHEIGHCIDHAKFVGKPLHEFKSYYDHPFQEFIPSYFSLKDALTNFIALNNRPEEKAANDAVGITREEIEDFITTLVGPFYS